MSDLKLGPINGRITNINIRRELHGDDERVLGVDLNVTHQNIDPKLLDQLTEFSKQKLSDFLGLTAEYPLWGIKTMSFEGSFDEHIVSLNYSVDDNHAQTFDDAKLVKFKADLKPSEKRVDLSYQIQLTPSTKQLHWLTDGATIEEWAIVVDGARQGDLLDEEQEDDEQNEAA